MYIWRRGPRRLEFLDFSPGRWGQAPDAVANGGRIPGAMARGARALAPWPTAAGASLYKGPSPSLLPPSTLHTYGFQPLRSAFEICF
jgi:hypothetical protein